MNGQMKKRKCCVCQCHHLVFDTPEEEKAYWEAKRKKEDEEEAKALKSLALLCGLILLGLTVSHWLGYLK